MTYQFTAAGNTLDDVIAATLWQALRRHTGNKSHAAEALGISRHQLRRMLQRPEYAAPEMRGIGAH